MTHVIQQQPRTHRRGTSPHAGHVQTADEENVAVGPRRLLALTAPEWLWLVMGTAVSALLGAVRPLFAVLLAASLSLMQPASSPSDGGRVVIFFVALAALQLVLSAAQVRSFPHIPITATAALPACMRRLQCLRGRPPTLPDPASAAWYRELAQPQRCYEFWVDGPGQVEQAE